MRGAADFWRPRVKIHEMGMIYKYRQSQREQRQSRLARGFIVCGIRFTCEDDLLKPLLFCACYTRFCVRPGRHDNSVFRHKHDRTDTRVLRSTVHPVSSVRSIARDAPHASIHLRVTYRRTRSCTGARSSCTSLLSSSGSSWYCSVSLITSNIPRMNCTHEARS